MITLFLELPGGTMKTARNCLLWIPAILWYRVIWNFSAQPASISGDLSDRLLWRLLTLFSPAFSAGETSVQTAAVELLSFFERKAAHMFLYFVLILLLRLALAPLVRGLKRQMALSAVLCAVLAALDEYHQTMVPGRSGQVRDVLIDLSGAALALALAALIRWSLRRRADGPQGPRASFPALAGLLLAAAIALSPISFSNLPVFSHAAQRFVPAFSSLSAAGQADLLSGLAPVLREVCLLAACGLLGCCCTLSALLGLRRLSWTLGGSFLTAGLLSLAVSAPVGIAMMIPAVSAALLGCGLFWAFWLLGFAAYKRKSSS